MTYHIKSKDYQCKNCDAVFILFHNDIVCPKCKTPATGGEAFDYIERICSSMRVHKRQFGQFMPSAWYTNNSLTENIQELCFRLYDELEEEKPNNEQKSLTEKIASLDLGEKYLNTHLKDIALAIYPIYKKENKFDISPLTNTMEEKYIKIQLSEELSHWFGREVFVDYGQGKTIKVMTLEYFLDLKTRVENLAHTQMKDTPRIAEVILAGISNCDVTNSGALFLPDYLEQHLSKNEDEIEIHEISTRLLILSRDSDILNEDFIKTLKETESKYSKKITILGEEYERSSIPHVAEMIDFNREDWEARIVSIAKAWHEGNTVSAVISLESDWIYG